MDAAKNIDIRLTWRNGKKGNDLSDCFKDAEAWKLLTKYAKRQGLPKDRSIKYFIKNPRNSEDTACKLKLHNILQRILKEKIKDVIWRDEISVVKTVAQSNLILSDTADFQKPRRLWMPLFLVLLKW